MEDKKVLLDAAALLVKLATGDKTTDPKLAEIIAAWEKLVEQFKKEDEKNASEFEIGKVYDHYRFVIDAAHREQWPDVLTGGAFWVGNYKTAKALYNTVQLLMQTKEYSVWAAHPANQNRIPKPFV